MGEGWDGGQNSFEIQLLKTHEVVMDIGIIIAYLLQIGIGVVMILAAKYRRKKYPNDHNSNLRRIGEPVALAWGWTLIVYSVLRLIIYLTLNK
jgi:hypothetical protein